MSAETTPRQPASPPPHAVMGLLNYLTATSLDEDYAHVSARRRAGAGTAPTRRSGTTALVILAVFGLLVATAFTQTARNADDARVRHDELVQQVVARRDQLEQQRSRAQELRAETTALEEALLATSSAGRAVEARLARLGLATGATAARGPGVRVVADDGPGAPGGEAEILDVDLQKLVNGLWLAGAEGIAINDQRLTSLTAIRLAGGVITVNYQRISAPYTVTVIGDSDALAARFLDTPGGQWWLDLQALYGVEFEIDRVESITLPAATRMNLRHALPPSSREVLR